MKKFLAIFLTMLFLLTPMTVLAKTGEYDKDDYSEKNPNEKSCYSDIVNYNEEEAIFLKNSEDPLITTKENTVEFSLQTNQEIVEISCEGIGINNISNNYLNGTIYVTFTYEEKIIDPKLTIAVLLQDEEILTADMYGYYFEEKLFISGISMDDAFEKYCSYLLKNEVIDENEYMKIRNTYYKQSVTITTNTEPAMQTIVAPDNSEIQAASKTTYVNGVLAWEDDNGVEHPCQHVKVNVYDKENGDDKLIATAYTNTNGAYSVAFENNSSIFELGGYDIYIVVYAAGDNLYVKNANGVKYSISTIDEVIENVDNGSTNSININFQMNDDGTLIGGDLGRAFQVSQPAIVASKYAREMLGISIHNVDIYYPVDSQVCWYNSNENRIYITGYDFGYEGVPKSYASWDVIMHEYGHVIQDAIGYISNSPGGAHYVNTNMADHYHEEILDGKLCKSCIENGKTVVESITDCRYKAMRLSWGEAWATTFGFMAQQYYIDTLSNISFVGDTQYNSYNIKPKNTFSLELYYQGSARGESNETAIISLLYNLFDSKTNAFDSISMGHSIFWIATLGSRPSVLSDFITYIVDNNLVDEDALAAMLDYYEINSRQKTVTNCNLTTRPSFSWDPRGGSVYYINNSFQLVFYDEDGVEIYKTSQITAWAYTLTQNEWNLITNNCENKFMWAIVSYQTDNIVTGPYRSVKSEIINISV